MPAWTMMAALHEITLSPAEAKQRFDWARRRGQPQWLWPALDVAAWREALEQIEAVLRGVMTGTSPKPHLSADPDALGVASYTSGVGPLLGCWAEDGRISVDAGAGGILSLHLRHNRTRMERMTLRAAKLARALTARGVRVVFLKGIHTAHTYFPQPGTRPLSDIDLWIDPRDELDAGRVLTRLGYVLEGQRPGPPPQRNWRLPGSALLPRSLSLVHEDDPWLIDVQPSLDRAYGLYTVHLDGVARQSATEPWPVSADAEVLGQPLLLLHLATHASCGLISMTLLRLVELAMVIRRDFRARPVLWNAFMETAGQARAAGMAYPALRMCEKLVPGSVPADVLACCSREAPDAVRRVMEPLTPAHAHRVLRYSLRERFMWTAGWADALRLIVRDAFMPGFPAAELIRIYRMRFWLLIRGTLTR